MHCCFSVCYKQRPSLLLWMKIRCITASWDDTSPIAFWNLLTKYKFSNNGIWNTAAMYICKKGKACQDLTSYQHWSSNHLMLSGNKQLLRSLTSYGITWGQWVNSLLPSLDATWRNRSESTFAQVMAYCLTAPRHYSKQCWLLIS